jgi:hypothetical protein
MAAVPDLPPGDPDLPDLPDLPAERRDGSLGIGGLLRSDQR